MKAKIFWTSKRLNALSRTSLTLFQAFAIGGTLGGVFGKIPFLWLKTLFVTLVLVFFSIGMVFSQIGR